MQPAYHRQGQQFRLLTDDASVPGCVSCDTDAPGTDSVECLLSVLVAGPQRFVAVVGSAR